MKDDALIEQILSEEDNTVDNEDIAENELVEEASNENTEKVGESVDEVGQEQTQELIIPEHWGTSIKDSLAKIEDANIKQSIFNEFKTYEVGMQNKLRELSDERKQFEEQMAGFNEDKNVVNSYKELEKSFAPEIHQAIQNQFGGTTGYYKHLMDMDMAYSKDPVTFLLNLSNSAGIDLAQLSELQKNPAVQQNYQLQQAQSQQNQNYENKIKQLEEMINGKFGEMETSKLLNDRMIAKDESGNLKYPHLSNDDVISAMDLLADRYPEADFDALYNESLYLVPDIRNNILNQNKVIEQKINESKQAIAPKQVKSKITSSETKKSMSDKELIDDILSDFED